MWFFQDMVCFIKDSVIWPSSGFVRAPPTFSLSRRPRTPPGVFALETAKYGSRPFGTRRFGPVPPKEGAPSLVCSSSQHSPTACLPPRLLTTVPLSPQQLDNSVESIGARVLRTRLSAEESKVAAQRAAEAVAAAEREEARLAAEALAAKAAQEAEAAAAKESAAQREREEASRAVAEAVERAQAAEQAAG